MSMSKTFSLIFNVLFIVKLCFSHPHHGKDKNHDNPKLLIVSLDGFRWDYLDIVRKNGIKTPNFDKLLQEGVTVKNGLENSFVTFTFPNHYTLVTGRYVENHGMVSNNYFDPLFNESFSTSNKDKNDAKWWNGESGTPVVPIWRVNELCGCTTKCECDRKSGTIQWPGSEVDELLATYFTRFNISVSFEKRVERVIKWFTQEEDPINFGLIYFHEPDATGHKHGPFSNEVAEMIGEIDKYLGYLLSQLENHGLLETSDLIITSDHGMMEQKEIIYLADYVNTSLFKVYSLTPVLHIYPHSGLKTKVYEELKKIPNVDVYLKENIPDELHYRNNRRISPIIISAHSFFELCISKDDCLEQKGDHGYNNSLSSMHPLFIARGTSFKKNFSTDSLVKNVDLFPLMAHLLKLPLPPSDGDLSRVLPLLSSSTNVDNENVIFAAIVLLISILALVFSICACHHHIKYWQRMTSHSIVSMKVIDVKGDPVVPESRKSLLGDESEEELI